MSSVRITPIGRGPMKATRTPRNLPPIPSASPPITPPPGFNDERPSSRSSTSRLATPAPQNSARLPGTPRRVPEIHSGRVLHEKGMPLLGKVRLKTIKDMRDRLKEWLPLTSERLDNMAEVRVIDAIAAASLKRMRDACERWDVLITDMDKNYEIIAHVWNYVMQNLGEVEKKNLHSRFQNTVNKRFNVMLEPLQLNRRRQGNVGDMMMTAVQQTQEDMDSLSVEISTYKEFTAKLGQLTDKEGASNTEDVHMNDIQMVYERLSGHIRDLEQEAETANTELSRMKESSKELRSQLQGMRDKNTELQSQIEYLQQMTLANAQLQAKNGELQSAILDMKKDIAMSQNIMMQELRSMREENRLRAQEERERLLNDLQEQMHSATLAAAAADGTNVDSGSARKGHSHGRRACNKK